MSTSSTSIRAYQRPGRPACDVDGCPQSNYCKGLCTMHYGRLRKRGSIGPAERRNVMPGTGSIDAYGYVIRHDPAHPLARAQGKVPEHRAVLYDTIGPQPQPCHWCGQVLMWTAESQGDRICVDHLDWNRQNNDPANLVPACLQCNAQRVEVFA